MAFLLALLMATFGQFEPTRQSGQPVELYKFFWGNQSNAGTSASQVGGTIVGCTGLEAVYAKDTWTGGNDADITGRVPDGGGNPVLAKGVWTDEYNPDVFGFNPNQERTTLDIVSGVVRQVGPGHTINRPFRSMFLSGSGIGQDQSPIVKAVFQSYDQPNDNAPATEAYARWNTSTGEGYEFYWQNYDPAGVPGFAYAEIARYDNFGTGFAVLDSDGTLTPLTLGVEHTFRFCVSGPIGNVVLQLYVDDVLVLSDNDTFVDGTEPVGDPGFGMVDYHTNPADWPNPPYSLPFPPYDSQGVHVTEFILAGPAAGAPGTAVNTDALLELNYTSADVPITYEGDVYSPFIAHRTSFNSGSGERTAAEIDLSVPFDHPVATLAMQGVPRGPIGCTVYRLDRQDTTDGAAAIPLQGQITRYRIEDRWCVVTLGNVGTLLTRKKPDKLTTRRCGHILYGPFCQLDQASHTHAGLTVTSVAGRSVVVSGASALSTDPTYLQEGVLLTTDGLREFIEAQSGDTLTMKQVVPGLELDATVTLIAGCLHTARACDRLGNIRNYGGEIGIPDRNPTTGAGIVGPGSTVEV